VRGGRCYARAVPSAIDAVILDVGGVFLLPDPVTIGARLASVDGLEVDTARLHRGHYAGVRALDVGGDWDAYLAAFVSTLDPPDDCYAAAADALRGVWMTPNLWRYAVPESVVGLRRLAATGCKLGIVSNADGTVEAELRAQQICQVGDGLGVPVLAIIDSTVVGIEKPDPGIFWHATQQLGVEPERAAYVGDSVHYDVRGARAAGLRPIHFDPYALCPERLDHAHVAALAEVAELV
jgi:putative hydrolase of the HAD superfamily